MGYICVVVGADRCGVWGETFFLFFVLSVLSHLGHDYDAAPWGKQGWVVHGCRSVVEVIGGDYYPWDDVV